MSSHLFYATRTCRSSSGDHMPVRVDPVVPTGLHAHKQPAPQRVTPDYISDVFLTLVLKPNDHGHSLLVELAQPVVDAVDSASPYTTPPPLEEHIESGGDGARGQSQTRQQPDVVHRETDAVRHGFSLGCVDGLSRHLK